jgi:hypothetical protein
MTRKFYNAKSSKPDEKALIKKNNQKTTEIKRNKEAKTTKIVPIFAAR